MQIDKRLIELNNIFKQKNTNLYIVGGFVRDALLGILNADVDLTSALRVEEVESLLKNTEFVIFHINKNFGTAKIKIDNVYYEYSTFRKESYDNKGKHCPDKVEFIEDIKTDSLRRDFTCNALYYNIETGKIIDFYNGMEHIKKRWLVMINKNTFDNDGVRILRMFRFIKTLNFKIEPATLKMAILNLSNVKQISKERKINEIAPIFSNINNEIIKNQKIEKFINMLENY